MPFMIPEYRHERAWRLETITGAELVFGLPADAPLETVAHEIGLRAGEIESAEFDAEAKWYCRLQAPGYMDCTEWSGPFDTEAKAKEELSNMYDVNPETGEDLED